MEKGRKKGGEGGERGLTHLIFKKRDWRRQSQWGKKSTQRWGRDRAQAGFKKGQLSSEKTNHKE